MKYNGKEFLPTLKNLPFKESVIYSIYENEQERKWISNSNKKIYEIINDSAFIVNGTQEISEQLKSEAHEIYQLYVDDSLNIYAKTTLSTFKFQKHKQYKPYDLAEMVFTDSCMAYVFEGRNSFIPILDLKANIPDFNLKSIRLKFSKSPDFKKNTIVEIKARQEPKYYKRFGDHIYTCTAGKMIKIDRNYNVKDIILNENILNFTVDGNGHLWVACYRNGLIEIDEHDSIINHYFKGKTIHDVLVDSDNGLWVSTDGSGIYHCRNLNELYYDESDPLGKPVNFIKSIGSKVFFGTTDFNLYYIENEKVYKMDKANLSLYDDPLDIFKFDSFYFICYRLHHEILKLPTSKVADITLQDKSFHVPFQVLNYSEDTLLFMGRNRIGVLAQQATTHKNRYDFYIKSVSINARACHSQLWNNKLFIGTDKGAYCFNGDTVVVPPYLKELRNSVVTKISVDALNNCWFCTKGNGLFMLNENHDLFHYTVATGLPGNIINDICFEQDNSFLLSNNKGLYYHPKPTGGYLNNFTKIFNGEVQTALHDGDKIYVGTKNGLVLLNARALIITPSVFFNLKSVYINSVETNESRLNRLSYTENTIEFRFDVISYAGKDYPLKYKLEGNTLDSGVVTSDKIGFKKLSPGCYTLTVYPVINGNQTKVIRKFTIVPAFWQTTWFAIAFVLCLILLMGVVIRGLFKYYKNKALKKNEADRIIAEYRLIALKAQINPHFMSNCIAAIQHLIINNKVDEANEYLAKFSFLVRQVLNFSTKSFVTLKDEIEIINLYVELERLRFDKIRFSITIDESINVDSVLIPPLLLQPIIENAIWHGLLPLGAKRLAQLRLTIKNETDFLRIEIEDNGVGRKVHQDNIGNLRDSKGIAITRQRIENLKHIYNFDSADIIYEDLVNEHAEPTGTRVIIFLPNNL